MVRRKMQATEKYVSVMHLTIFVKYFNPIRQINHIIMKIFWTAAEYESMIEAVKTQIPESVQEKRMR